MDFSTDFRINQRLLDPVKSSQTLKEERESLSNYRQQIYIAEPLASGNRAVMLPDQSSVSEITEMNAKAMMGITIKDIIRHFERN